MSKGMVRGLQPIAELVCRQVVGSLDASGLRFGVVVSRFNDVLTDELCRQAVACLCRYGASIEAVVVVRVPGAYEIPVVAQRMAREGGFDALILLGVVVEGETQHAQMIIDSTGVQVLQLACETGLPIINEIVGVRSWAQAEARCLGGEQSRGWYAAEAAIETVRVLKQL